MLSGLCRSELRRAQTCKVEGLRPLWQHLLLLLLKRSYPRAQSGTLSNLTSCSLACGASSNTWAAVCRHPKRFPGAAQPDVLRASQKVLRLGSAPTRCQDLALTPSWRCRTICTCTPCQKRAWRLCAVCWGPAGLFFGSGKHPSLLAELQTHAAAFRAPLQCVLCREIHLFCELAYYGLTTGAGTQTLGEEYCDILQVSGVSFCHAGPCQPRTAYCRAMHTQPRDRLAACAFPVQARLGCSPAGPGGGLWCCCTRWYPTPWSVQPPQHSRKRATRRGSPPALREVQRTGCTRAIQTQVHCRAASHLAAHGSMLRSPLQPARHLLHTRVPKAHVLGCRLKVCA